MSGTFVRVISLPAGPPFLQLGPSQWSLYCKVQTKNMYYFEVVLGLNQKFGHHCHRWNLFFNCPFFPVRGIDMKLYITWINNHLIMQFELHKKPMRLSNDQIYFAATHLKVQWLKFRSKILSVAKIHFRLSCFSSFVIIHREYTMQSTYFNKKRDKASIEHIAKATQSLKCNRQVK